MAESANACDAAPNAVDSELVAEAPVPILMLEVPVAAAFLPIAIASVPVAPRLSSLVPKVDLTLKYFTLLSAIAVFKSLAFTAFKALDDKVISPALCN